MCWWCLLRVACWWCLVCFGCGRVLFGVLLVVVGWYRLVSVVVWCVVCIVGCCVVLCGVLCCWLLWCVGQDSALVLIGMGDATTTLSSIFALDLSRWIPPWLMKHVPQHIADNILFGDSDMIDVAKKFQIANAGWAAALTMAADENSLANMYLRFEYCNKQPLVAADPYNGARRASDENNTRRTTLMEVAVAFNSDSYALARFLKQPGYLEHTKKMSEKLRQNICVMHEQQVESCDRDMILSVVGHELDRFLSDLSHFHQNVALRACVRHTIRDHYRSR
eukprot:m.110565 g.110565  ORF g.110565 m.110565 type:complete len:279 (-) comp28052_c0_seq2:224-1060(-)